MEQDRILAIYSYGRICGMISNSNIIIGKRNNLHYIFYNSIYKDLIQCRFDLNNKSLSKIYILLSKLDNNIEKIFDEDINDLEKENKINLAIKEFTTDFYN